MKRAGTVLLLVVVSWGLDAAIARPRDPRWHNVEDAVRKGLPKSAITELEPIARDALRDRNHAEAIKAIARRITLEGQIEGGRPAERITRMKAAIATAPAAMRPVMRAILADWTWEYYQSNRWRFVERGRQEGGSGDDLATWDLSRILEEIDQQFTLAFASAELLKMTPIAEYDELLVRGNVADAARPTLYDFLVFEALEFYSAGEQAGARAEDAFDLLADGPIFAPAEEFVRWRIEAPDSASPKLKAITLYQGLLRFHARDPDPGARIDADLWRLRFGKNTASGEQKRSRYQVALRRLSEEYADHELSALVLHDWAVTLEEDNDRIGAWRLANRGRARFPNSIGGRRCASLIQRIEARSVWLVTERVWNDPLPEIEMRYRNLTRVHFRAVPFDFERWMRRSHRSTPDRPSREQVNELLERQPARAWSSDLPATDDFQDRTERLPAPQGLGPGSYFLIASHDSSFREPDNQVSVAVVWVSDLALVSRERHGSGGLEGMVLSAGSGEPISGAEVRGWTRGPGWRPGPWTRTDADGAYRLEYGGQGQLVEARHHGQSLVTHRERWVQKEGSGDGTQARTTFFTDRSIYRPGQTIHYKGICFEADHRTDRYQTLAGRALTVVFKDFSSKELARREHHTNDYGSFSGTFVAPADRLLGSMMIKVENGPEGGTWFRVEEYKRPRFQVTLDAPTAPAQLDAAVSLHGHAVAYMGASIDQGTVRWRVTRHARFPVWWRWDRGGSPSSDDQEIAHGVTNTAADGAFAISFIARPDLSIGAEDEVWFNYAVHADVTDAAGETRSAGRVVSIGHRTLTATLTAEDWQTHDRPVAIRLRTATLDGVASAAAGVLTVHRLKEPSRATRARIASSEHGVRPLVNGKRDAVANDADPSTWVEGEAAFEMPLATDTTGAATANVRLRPGLYRARFRTQDRFGHAVTAELPLRVIDPGGRRLGIRVTNLFTAPSWSVEPGGDFVAVWGTGYETGRAFVEIEHRGRLLQSFWTDPGRTQVLVRQRVTESMRGGFMVRVTMVRENRAYLHGQMVQVPWTNQELSVTWERLISKLAPRQRETWTVVVRGRDSTRAIAEMVATLYDASLDAIASHGWMSGFGVFRREWRWSSFEFENRATSFAPVLRGWRTDPIDTEMRYRSFPPELGTRSGSMEARYRAGDVEGLKIAGVETISNLAVATTHVRGGRPKGIGGMISQSITASSGADVSRGTTPDLGVVSTRKNLQETAFFFPHLISDRRGVVKMEFTMPEALTEWRFIGFAHDRRLRGGLLQGKAVTSTPLMVQPNPPRFLREGDQLEFTVKVVNRTDQAQAGTVRLTLTDGATGGSADEMFMDAAPERDFDLPAMASRTFSWKLDVPDAAGVLIYRAVAATKQFSDGEEGALPVLPRRVLVTESLPLPIRGRQAKTFDFASLRQSGLSSTLRHRTLSVQMASNPSWYAVMALPYLMEFPYPCTEQTFNRLYANALAHHIAASDPKIHRVFEQWRGTAALDSPLEKNQDLEAVMIEETPWIRQAESESQSRRRAGVLFDDERMEAETRRSLSRLADAQLPDGAWPWFPGGRANDYITLYITTGFGRLRHLGIAIDTGPAVKSLARLDRWMDERYRDLLRRGQPEANHLSTTVALYLYGRSFFLEDRPIAPPHDAALKFWLGQARDFWVRLGERQSQAHLALALQRFGDPTMARAIVRSLGERSVSDPELGMFWRDLEFSWWWYRAPIETQAMMIEAFDEVARDSTAVEECKVWLLKQKQTQDWKTTKATADAIYALTLGGTDRLASDALVAVALGGRAIHPEQVEAGTGFTEHRFAATQIVPALAKIEVAKSDDGVAWGSVHWQYEEDAARVKPHAGTPLTLRKTLHVRHDSKQGPVLEPITGPLQVGDELLVRLELRVDRDMEYIHLEDHRGSGVEPVHALSGYRIRDGLAYYETTRDAATHFFIDYLPKGTYVFDYPVRVQHRGRYQTGLARIQCMYAPEFNGHSGSVLLEVR